MLYLLVNTMLRSLLLIFRVTDKNHLTWLKGFMAYPDCKTLQQSWIFSIESSLGDHLIT